MVDKNPEGVLKTSKKRTVQCSAKVRGEKAEKEEVRGVRGGE